jgi:hypothetical protein
MQHLIALSAALAISIVSMAGTAYAAKGLPIHATELVLSRRLAQLDNDREVARKPRSSDRKSRSNHRDSNKFSPFEQEQMQIGLDRLNLRSRDTRFRN